MRDEIKADNQPRVRHPLKAASVKKPDPSEVPTMTGKGLQWTEVESEQQFALRQNVLRSGPVFEWSLSLIIKSVSFCGCNFVTQRRNAWDNLGGESIPWRPDR